MDWRLKARIQRVLGRIPFGRDCNYLLQRFVTHTYPRRGPVLDQVVSTAARHRDNIEGFGGRPLESSTSLEFGAGWDLAAPLALAGYGIGTQLLFDIEPVARATLVHRVIADLVERGHLPGPVPSSASIDELVGRFGISYRAPGDARATGLTDRSVDVVISTSTLEHIAPPDIEAILAEMRRVLRPEGICSFAIDYHDHFAGADGTIHSLNFLRFPSTEWARWNCPMQFQNRLRHPDFVELFERAGFEVADVDAIVDPSLPDDIEICEEFAHYDAADLRITDGWFVLRPR